MSILIVSVDFPPHRDGVSRITDELASGLSKSKKIVIIAPGDRGAREYDRRHGYVTIRTPFYNCGYLRFIPILFCMPYAMRKYGVKKVFAMNVAYGGVVSYVLSKFFNVPYVLFAYGYEFCKYEKNPLMRKLLLRVYSGSEKILALSNFVRNRLSRFGVDRNKIEIINPGVRPDKFKPVSYGTGNERKTLLTVARLVERKGHDVVLRALCNVKKHIPDVLYVIAGEGVMENSLKGLTKKLKLEDNVRFVGKVSDDDELVYLYNLCDVFIMVNRNLEESGHVEGFGIVYLEANACGKPVIGGRAGGVVDAIVEGETGLLVAPLDVEEISGAILTLLQDKSYAEELGKNGLMRVRQEVNWEKFLERVNRICA